MLKKILIAFATVVGLVLAIGLALPSKYRVERSTILQAPPEAVYPYVANLQRWQEWAPWNAKRYPGSQWMFGGPAEGAGAVHSWSGEDVGQGTLSLTQADPKTGVAYDMSVAQGRYLMHGRITFAPVESGTRVTWVDEGDIGGNPLAHYLVPLIRSRLGGDMEAGLARLAKVVQAPAAAPLEPEPEPEPAPVEQASAPPRPPASAPPAPAPVPTVEGTPSAAPPAEGTVVASPTPATEGSQGTPPAETPPVTAATTPPEGGPAPASQGPVVPSGEPAPAQTPPTAEPVPAPVPASAPADASSTPTQP